jgi:uncharacterized membrane protein (DUF485 family)
MDGTPDRSALLQDPEFLALTATKNRISTWLTAATLFIYFGFILLIAFKRDLFAAKAFGNVTVGVLLGIGVIAASFVLTGVYVRWANSKYDDMVDTVRRKAGHGG